MDQGPGIVHSRHGSRQEHLEERLMRSCSGKEDFCCPLGGVGFWNFC